MTAALKIIINKNVCFEMPLGILKHHPKFNLVEQTVLEI